MRNYIFGSFTPFKNVAQLVGLLAALVFASSVTHAQDASFVNWENLPLHAVDLSPDGGTLAVVN